MLDYIFHTNIPMIERTFMEVFTASFNIWTVAVDKLNNISSPALILLMLWPMTAIVYVFGYLTILGIYGLWIMSSICKLGPENAYLIVRILLAVIVWVISVFIANVIIFTIGEKIDDVFEIDAFHRLNSTIFVAGCATMAYQAAKHTFGFNLKAKGE